MTYPVGARWTVQARKRWNPVDNSLQAQATGAAFQPWGGACSPTGLCSSDTRPTAMLTTRRTALVVGIFSVVLGACGGGKPAPGAAYGSDLPRWEGPLRSLFDDVIDPAAVGLSMEPQSPAEDLWLRSRAQNADLVARMRVQTVTRERVGARTTYTLNLQVGMPTLMPAHIDDTTIELVIKNGSPAFGVVSSLDSQLRGKIFIAFVSRFMGLEGPELHWHLTADTEEVARVVRELAVLDEVAGQSP